MQISTNVLMFLLNRADPDVDDDYTIVYFNTYDPDMSDREYYDM